MNRFFHVFILTLFVSTSANAGDDAKIAYKVLDQYLRKDDGGIVLSHRKCPKSIDNSVMVPIETKIANIDEDRAAVIVTAEQCSGGNRLGQYLVITEGASGRWIADADIGDLNFLVETVTADGNLIRMRGLKFGREDPHCCPSIKGTLEYNIATKKQKFVLEK